MGRDEILLPSSIGQERAPRRRDDMDRAVFQQTDLAGGRGAEGAVAHFHMVIQALAPSTVVCALACRSATASASGSAIPAIPDDSAFPPDPRSRIPHRVAAAKAWSGCGGGAAPSARRMTASSGLPPRYIDQLRADLAAEGRLAAGADRDVEQGRHLLLFHRKSAKPSPAVRCGSQTMGREVLSRAVSGPAGCNQSPGFFAADKRSAFRHGHGCVLLRWS